MRHELETVTPQGAERIAMRLPKFCLLKYDDRHFSPENFLGQVNSEKNSRSKMKFGEFLMRGPWEVAPAFRGRDLKLIVNFTLTARGISSGVSDDKVRTWFETAHEWIVRGFDELTTPAMHEIWRKKPCPKT